MQEGADVESLYSDAGENIAMCMLRSQAMCMLRSQAMCMLRLQANEFALISGNNGSTYIDFVVMLTLHKLNHLRSFLFVEMDYQST